MLTPLILGACGSEEPEPVPIPEPEIVTEEIDMEQYRVSGDRVKDEPVLGSEDREKRLIKQYETVDRPILMNTLRHIISFDNEHKGAFDGVRLITDNTVDEVKERKVAEYLEHLGEPMRSETTKIYDIGEVYPYSGDDYKSYYNTVVKILQREVVERTQIYNNILTRIDNREFEDIRTSGNVTNFQSVIESDKGLIEQIRPYIQEMDKLVAQKRVELGLPLPKFTEVKNDMALEPEPEAEYVVPKKATVQEIMSIEPTSELYDDEEESDKTDEEDNNSEEPEEGDTEEQVEPEEVVEQDSE